MKDFINCDIKYTDIYFSFHKYYYYSINITISLYYKNPHV